MWSPAFSRTVENYLRQNDAVFLQQQLPFRGEIHLAVMLFLMIDIMPHGIEIREADEIWFRTQHERLGR